MTDTPDKGTATPKEMEKARATHAEINPEACEPPCESCAVIAHALHSHAAEAVKQRDEQWRLILEKDRDARWRDQEERDEMQAQLVAERGRAVRLLTERDAVRLERDRLQTEVENLRSALLDAKYELSASRSNRVRSRR